MGQKQRVWKLSVLVAAGLPLLLAFQNCSPQGGAPSSQKSLATSSASTTKNSGGSNGGYDGKATVYIYRNPDKVCAVDESTGISTFLFDDKTGQLFFAKENCIALATPRLVESRDWQWGAEDRSVILYKGMSFVDETRPNACQGKQVGEVCAGTPSLYLGNYQMKNYMITPPGCEDSSNPTCSGLEDVIAKPWQMQPLLTQANTTDGLMNSWRLANEFAESKPQAAQFCRNMRFGGYSDWYLPSVNEWMMLIYPRLIPLKIRLSHPYWTSSEISLNNALRVEVPYKQAHSIPVASYSKSQKIHLVRCIRRY